MVALANALAHDEAQRDGSDGDTDGESTGNVRKQSQGHYSHFDVVVAVVDDVVLAAQLAVTAEEGLDHGRSVLAAIEQTRGPWHGLSTNPLHSGKVCGWGGFMKVSLLTKVEHGFSLSSH